MKKITAPEETAKNTSINSTIKPTRPPFKLETVLLTFIDRGDLGMYQLEASKLYGESCLHTSVSILYHNHGIKFRRQSESIKNRVGTISNFTRYWFLDEGDEMRAKKLFNDFRNKRGLVSLVWEVSLDEC